MVNNWVLMSHMEMNIANTCKKHASESVSLFLDLQYLTMRQYENSYENMWQIFAAL